MAKGFSRHHIVPQSRDGSSHPDNIVRLVDRYHVALHWVFQNMMPHEQIARILEISWNAISRDFRSDVLAILDKDQEYIYRKWVLIPKL